MSSQRDIFQIVEVYVFKSDISAGRFEHRCIFPVWCLFRLIENLEDSFSRNYNRLNNVHNIGGLNYGLSELSGVIYVFVLLGKDFPRQFKIFTKHNQLDRG